MKIKIFLLLSALFGLIGCSNNSVTVNLQNGGQNTEIASNQQNAGNVGSTNATKTPSNSADNKTAAMTGNEPRTVRDFFNRLPQKYFTLEGCEPKTDKNCERAREDFYKRFLEVEDIPNGYLKFSCDGAQSCLRMALFKRPDDTYVVGVHTLHEGDEINYFLEYKNGNWLDISSKIIPSFSKDLIYELPRVGTTIEVYNKFYPEPEYSERGKKAYQLEWKDGKFSVKN